MTRKTAHAAAAALTAVAVSVLLAGLALLAADRAGRLPPRR